MTACRVLAGSAVVAAALAAASTAVAGGNFTGSAQSVVLTAAQAKYKALTGSGEAAAPPLDKKRGYRSGWQASYLKGTAAKPVGAYSLVYVYDTVANARRAYANSCQACTGKVELQGITMKYELTNENGTPAVVDIATCRNLYVATVVTGKLSSSTLAQAAGALAGGIFAKAAAGGMSPCVTANAK